MNSDRWQQVKEVLDAALKRSPEERVRFLDEACQNDDELRGEVETLNECRTLAKNKRLA